MTQSTQLRRHSTRERLPDRRLGYRHKVRILDDAAGDHTFYVEFGHYSDGRLGEVFITTKRFGTFSRGVLDSLAYSISLELQCGTTPHELARQLCGEDFPPRGQVRSEGSVVTECSSILDYIGQEILASYDEDGRRVDNADVTTDGDSAEAGA